MLNFFSATCFISRKSHFARTRRDRLKSTLYLRLKKRKIFFLEKNEFSKFFLSENVAVQKNVKGGPFLSYKHAFCSKITKNSKGDPLGTIKKFRKKVAQCRKKLDFVAILPNFADLFRKSSISRLVSRNTKGSSMFEKRFASDKN